MSTWRSWRLQQWSEQLLRHYFGRRDEGDVPVVALLATPEELARAAADPSADPAEVRDFFIATVRKTVAYASLLDHASDYEGWPGPPPPYRVPRFVSHLIFTCIAASESSEELASEGSYLQRLRELAGGVLPDHSLQWLPTLWENLAAWLEANAEGYRPLKLPDPGGYTRIGYTVKLTFPDRRDQRALSELLGREGLSGHDPPVGKVIALVAAARGQFRRPFIEAFDDFRRRLACRSPHAKDLVEHRFWSAVRDASLRGRRVAEEAGPEGSARFQLLCEEENDRLHPFLVTDEPLSNGLGLATIELPLPFDKWRYAVARSGQGNNDPEAVYSTARLVLQGGLAIPRLTSLAVQGLLPLVDGVHGYLELAGPDRMEESRTALARRELSQTLIDMFGKGRARSRASIIEGWVEIRGLQLRRLPSEMLERTALGTCWQLYESIARNGVRLQGGVRADDGWLGYREVLPRILATSAQEVHVRRPGGTSEQLHIDDDRAWHLPPQDHEGEYDIEAVMDDGSVERVSARFNLVVGTESFRMPDELDAWIVEGVGGTGTLSMLAPLSASLGDGVAPIADSTTYLGPIVGQFVGGAHEAAWLVTRFAGKTRVARCRHDLAEGTGAARLADASARRKWRKLLLNCAANPADDGFDAARSRIRQRVVGQLPIVDAVSQAVPVDLARTGSAAPEVERLLSIAAARAGGRTGIPYGEWSRHVESVLEVPRDRVRAITRSWAEAGVLDIAFYARWTLSRVFACAPRLVVCRTEHGFGATITGMVLPTTRGSVVAAAKQAGVDIEERCGVSALAPSLMTMRCSRMEQFDDLSNRTGMPLSWLALDIEHYAGQCRHDGLDLPPQNYEERVPWTRWSLGPVEDRAGISFERCTRHARPDYWQVTSRGRSVWSYDLNTARLWAAAMLGEKALTVSGVTGLTAVHGYLPLPLARFLSVLEGTAPGVDQNGQYRYRVSTPELTKRLMNVVERIFDARRLAAQVQTMTG
jgi:hypothetical protein